MSIIKKRLVILCNESLNDHSLWIKACEACKDKLEYRVVNLTKNNWLDRINSLPFDILLAKPGGLTAHYKQLYDERIFILGHVLGYKIFPSPLEIFIYENKRFLSYWLKANRISHPITDIFYERKEAIEYIKRCKFPFVAKINIGASGSGVRIISNKKEAHKYIEDTFLGKGSPRRSGPNFNKGGILQRGFHYVFHPSDISRKIDIYWKIIKNMQKGFVIFQEYIPHDFEWRVVRIGDSFFAHKKLKSGCKASGSLLKQYDDPPFKLLDSVKKITDTHNFYSQAIDIFESDRGYLVNEIQCIFGQSDPYQMLVNDIPGRYRYLNGGWLFEHGDFTSNQCYNLRLEFLLENQF